MQSMIPRVYDRIFISYSHADRKWLELFKKHLKPYLRQGSFSVWSDTQIKTGQLWKFEITRELGTAGVALLLVSPDFISSDFIADEELPKILAAAKEEGLLIYWVPIRDSAYETTFLKEIQSRPTPSSPLASLSLAKRDRALVGICKEIAEAVQSLHHGQQANQGVIALPSQAPEPEDKELSVGQNESDLEYQERGFRAVMEASSRVLTPLNAKITPAAKIQPEQDSPVKQIDILVDFQTRTHHFKIAIETKFLKSPTSLMDVDEYAGKYNVLNGIMVDKCILVSHSFTDDALVHGKKWGIEMFTSRNFEHQFAKFLVDMGATQFETDDNFWREFHLTGCQHSIDAFIEKIKVIGIKPKRLKHRGGTSFELLTTDGPYFYDYAVEVAEATDVLIGSSQRRSTDSFKEFN